MSIERLHRVFITGCVLVTAIVAAWALNQDDDWLFGFLALAGGAALTIDSRMVARMSRQGGPIHEPGAIALRGLPSVGPRLANSHHRS